MAFYANVDAEAASFSPKIGISLDAFALRPMPEATFPQLRPSIFPRPPLKKIATEKDNRLKTVYKNQDGSGINKRHRRRF